MGFPGTTDYIMSFGDPGVIGTPTVISDWIDTGGHARDIDVIFSVCVSPTPRTMTLFQNSTSVDTGSSQVTLPADFSSQTVFGTYKYRLPPSDVAGDWAGNVNGRYLKTIITKFSNCAGQTLVMVHRSGEYPVE